MNSMIVFATLAILAVTVSAGGLGGAGSGLVSSYGLGAYGGYGLGGYGGYGHGGYGGYGLGGYIQAYRPATGLSHANSNSAHYGGVAVLASPAYSLGYGNAGLGYGAGYGIGYGGLGYGAGYGIGYNGLGHGAGHGIAFKG